MKKLKYLALVALLVPVAIVLTACGALAAPTSLTRTATALTFSAVEGAAAYQIRVTHEGITRQFNVEVASEADLNYDEINATKTGNTISIALEDLVAAVTVRVNMPQADGGIAGELARQAFLEEATWTVSVRAVEAAGSNGYRASAWSSTTTITPAQRGA